MDAHDGLALQFEESRPHLRAVAHRILGSSSDAGDAVQKTWLRLSRADRGEIANLGGWLTTVVARVSLDTLRSRKSRREEVQGLHLVDTAGDGRAGVDPEREALRAESIGLALLVVLDTLAPPERVAFVLHCMFGLPFDEIAPVVGRTPTATRQLASRGRRRVQGAATVAGHIVATSSHTTNTP
jgi:RNA polymerase sigma-70 factor (ECF subfamily)